MQRSTTRILTTLTGSLPRPEDLLQMLYAREDGQLTSEEALETRYAGYRQSTRRGCSL
jgi:5-methyltetrahydropteroyltriglutamate--homocysteine methyltransferase